MFRLCRRPCRILHELKTSSPSHNTLPMQVLQPSNCISYPPTHHISGYGEMESLPIRSYNDVGDSRTQALSPNSSASSPSTVYSTSIGRSSKATSRSPPTRQRTPIRHHRGSTTRVHNSGRAEALLAYAIQQEAQAAPSHNMPSSQSAFPPDLYMMPPATSSYQVQGGYYHSAGMPQPQQSGQYMLAPSSYNVEPNPSTYFGLGRSAPYPIDTLPPTQPPDSLYQPELDTNVPPLSWTSSTAVTHLPSMPLPSNAFCPSTASSMDPCEEKHRPDWRPKPQCFDHGCNGRQFSTFSNLLRHQREKSGSASKAKCPYCGTEFTRTTARNGHLYGGKCKGRDGQGIPEPEARPEPGALPEPEASPELEAPPRAETRTGSIDASQYLCP